MIKASSKNQKSFPKHLNPEQKSKISFIEMRKAKTANLSKNLHKSRNIQKIDVNKNPNFSSCQLTNMKNYQTPHKQIKISNNGNLSFRSVQNPSDLDSPVFLKKYISQYSSQRRKRSELQPAKNVLIETNYSHRSQKSAAIKRNIQQYSLLKLIGRGRFGLVFQAIHKRTGFIGALKILQKSAFSTLPFEHRQKMLKQLINQIKIQAYLKHPNLIQLYDFFSDDKGIYLFIELGTDRHLMNLLQLRGPFQEETVSIIIREIVQGIGQMHSKFIIHRDLKLENIVFTCGMAKICDFGWSIHNPKGLRSTLCGTPLYLPPEMLKGEKYDEKIDMWAIGTLAHELVTGKTPFGITKKEELRMIVDKNFQMKRGSPELKSFLTFILRKEPGNRPDADILMRHPFITKYRDIETSEEICHLIAQLEA